MKKILLVFVLAITMFTACNKAYDDSALTERIENLEGAMAELINNMTIKLEVLQDQITDLESLRAKLDELEQLKVKIAELEKLKDKVAELEALQAKIAELEKLTDKVTELEVLRAKVVELEKLKDKVAELEALQTKVAELESTIESLSSLSTKILAIETKLAELIDMNAAITEDADQSNETIEALQDLIEDLKIQLTELKKNVYVGPNKFIGKRYYKITTNPELNLESIYNSYSKQIDADAIRFTENVFIKSSGEEYSYIFLADDMFLLSNDNAKLITISTIFDYLVVFTSGEQKNTTVYVLAEDLERFETDRLAYLAALPAFKESTISTDVNMNTTLTSGGKLYCKQFIIENNSGRLIKITNIEIKDTHTNTVVPIEKNDFPSTLGTGNKQTYTLSKSNDFDRYKYSINWTYEVDGHTYTSYSN
ncbi:hypothetical protein ACXR6G_11430 [Ancylomarina sp. YFZ004]